VKEFAARPYVGPAALLLAATLAVVPLRSLVHDAPAAPVKARNVAPSATHVGPAAKRPAHRLYTVKGGDTLAAIAVRTGVPVAKLLELNPKAQPTSLFIGQQLRLR
jgi:LysM repeat protein